MLKVACIIPTYNAGTGLIRLLDSLNEQSAVFETLVVDSNSSDGTLKVAQERVSRVTVIPSKDFNHGGTRQHMVELNQDYEVYIYLTQDAYLADDQAIERILAYFSDPRIGAVCGRQLPHLDASPFAQHARMFNYPAVSGISTMADVPRLGLKTAFMSNSFAAYRAAALRDVGGFPSHVIFGEDMFVSAKMLLRGWKVAYAGDAQCHHSHNYAITEEFRRYFDMGVFHSREPWIRASFGGAGGEGMRYVLSELKYLGLHRVHLWPLSIIRNALKLTAYKLGQNERYISVKWKQYLGMSQNFWRGPFAECKVSQKAAS